MSGGVNLYSVCGLVATGNTRSCELPGYVVRPIMVPQQVVLLRDRLMERTALDGGQFFSGDRPERSYGANSGLVLRF